MSRRYPLHPLAAVLRVSLNQLCTRFNISGETRKKYLAGGVGEKAADRLAVKAGFDPYSIWPEMVDHHLADVSVECANPACSARFVPVRKSHKFCSTRCKNAPHRHWRRDRYRNDPEYAARARAERRAYYEQYGDYERARERRKYAKRGRSGREAA